MKYQSIDNLHLLSDSFKCLQILQQVKLLNNVLEISLKFKDRESSN